MSDRNSFSRRVWYRGWYWSVRLLMLTLYRIRIHGERNIPEEGGLMLLANHQSHLDPPFIGSACRRRMNFLARKTLFQPPLSWLIGSLDAIPLDQEGIGLSGIKETLKRLKGGEPVLIFPEGSRSWDGEMQPLMPGFCALARRSRVPLVPAGIAGAHEGYARGTRLPRTGCVHIVFGRPIQPEEIAGLADEQLLALVEERIRDCFFEARRRRRRSMSAFPEPRATIGLAEGTHRKETAA